MSFNRTEVEHQRRVILEILNTDPNHSHNDAVLKGSLRMIGHTVSTDHLVYQLEWLEKQGLVVLDNVKELIVVKLTQNGQDVAVGALNGRGIAPKGL